MHADSATCFTENYLGNLTWYPIVASRMSPAVAVEFCKKPMESVLLCTACGTCMELCPYELSIPEILQSNYALYEKHLKATII